MHLEADHFLWFFPSIFVILFGVYLMILYIKDKDKGKLMFSISFLTASISYLLLALNLENSEGAFPSIRIYHWAVTPLIIAIFMATNDTFFKLTNKNRSFTIFISIYLFSSVTVILPYDLGLMLTVSRIILAIEVLTVSGIRFAYKRNTVDLLFILGVLTLSFAGSQMRAGKHELAIFSTLTGLIFLSLMFKESANTKKETEQGIDSYFSLKEKLTGTQQVLKKTEQKLESVLSNIPNIVMIVDDQGTIMYINHSKPGFEAEDAIGKMVSDYTKPHYWENERQALENVFETGKPGDYVVEKFGPDGLDSWCEIKVGPIFHEKKVESAIMISTDITDRIRTEKEIKEKVRILERNEKATLNIMEDLNESLAMRKKVEEALRVSEENLRRMLESSPDSIAVTDLNGNLIECNQATLDLYGFSSKKEVLGKNTFDFFSKKDLEKAMENMERTLTYGSLKNAEYSLLTKDGKEFPAELSASVITDASGNPTSLIAITKDISERKSAEKALKEKTEKLEKFARLSIGREKKMVELKERIKELEGIK